MEGSHTIQLSRGRLPSFPSFLCVCVLFGGWGGAGGVWRDLGVYGAFWGGWFAFHLPLIFPLVRAVTPSLSLRPEVSEVPCVDAEAMFAALVGTEARTEALVSALTSKRAPLSLDTTTPPHTPHPRTTPDPPFYSLC